jgi:hypothetical protein
VPSSPLWWCASSSFIRDVETSNRLKKEVCCPCSTARNRNRILHAVSRIDVALNTRLMFFGMKKGRKVSHEKIIKRKHEQEERQKRESAIKTHTHTHLHAIYSNKREYKHEHETQKTKLQYTKTHPRQHKKKTTRKARINNQTHTKAHLRQDAARALLCVSRLR